jgi:hypothetical protein
VAQKIVQFSKYWIALSVNKILFTVLGLLFFFAPGCTKTVVYDSPIPPTPLMQEPGKLTVSPYYGTNGVNVNAAYSLPGQFVVTAGMLYNNTGGDRADPYSLSDSKLYNDAHLFRSYEFAIGPFFSFEDDAVCELLVGKGHGSGEDYVYSDEFWNWHQTKILKKETGNFDKIFAQINFGRHTAKSKSGVAIRCSYINYRNYELVHTMRGVESTDIPSGLIWEPMVFGEFGSDHVKFSINVVYPIAPATIEFGYRRFILAAGLVFSFF